MLIKPWVEAHGYILELFDFAQGNSQDNRVVITNHSKHHGIVTSDAVRFGGGMATLNVEEQLVVIQDALKEHAIMHNGRAHLHPFIIANWGKMTMQMTLIRVLI